MKNMQKGQLFSFISDPIKKKREEMSESTYAIIVIGSVLCVVSLVILFVSGVL